MTHGKIPQIHTLRSLIDSGCGMVGGRGLGKIIKN